MKVKIFILLAALVTLVLVFTSCDGIIEDSHEHTWKEATCTSPKICSDCGVTEGEALGHTEETLEGKDATCTEAGLTKGKKCSVCGEILAAQETIPVASHTEETIEGKDATCTETGLTEGKKCSVCGEILTAQEEIPAAHKEEVLAAEEPTCTETGLTEGKKCSVCGEILVAQETIPVASHTEETLEGKDATCTEAGLTEGKKCSVCGEILTAQDEIPVTNHKDDDGNFRCDYPDCNVIIGENILAGMVFVPTEEANNVIFNQNYGYSTLTDGIISNSSGRFSTKDAMSIMDATVDLKANYALSYIKLYYFFEYWRVGANDHTYVGANLKLEVLNDGAWTTVFDYSFADLAQYVVSRDTKDPGDGWLEICLNGVRAEQIRISSTAGNGTSISYYEVEVLVDKSTRQDLPEINVLEGKEFVPTDAANNAIYGASYGYSTLTDGIISNSSGRFSTKDATSIMDATVDLKANYALSYIKLYYFFEYWRVGANDHTYVGANLKLEVLNDGAWTTVFDYSFADLAQYVVSRDANNPGDGWLEIDLNEVRAEQVRISSTAGNGTSISYYEIEIFSDKSTAK